MCSPAQAADPRNNTLLYAVFATRVQDFYGRIQDARIVGPGRKRRIILYRRRNTAVPEIILFIIKTNDIILFYQKYIIMFILYQTY